MGNTWSTEAPFCSNLLLFYSALGAGANLKAYFSPIQTVSYLSLLRFTSSVWLGLLIGISGTEAWVKFKAPLVERHFKFDIGRLVFMALNAVELGLCVTLCSSVALLNQTSLIHVPGYVNLVPIGLAGILGVQSFFLTPHLNKMAKQLLVEKLTEGDMKDEEKRKKFIQMKGEVEAAGENIKQDRKLHVLYVALEAVKAVTLGVYAFNV